METYKTLTDRDWELLEAIDGELTSGSFEFDKMERFLNSITLEEMAALIKWLNRNTDKYFPMDGDRMNIVAKTVVLEEYIRANINEYFENFDKISDMIKIWAFMYKL